MTVPHRFAVALIAAAAGLTISFAYVAGRGFDVTLVDLFVIQFAYVAAYVPAVAVAETYLLERFGPAPAHPGS